MQRPVSPPQVAQSVSLPQVAQSVSPLQVAQSVSKLQVAQSVSPPLTHVPLATIRHNNRVPVGVGDLYIAGVCARVSTGFVCVCVQCVCEGGGVLKEIRVCAHVYGLCKC